MPLYEFVLRYPGRPDELLISDYDGQKVGDELEFHGRRWIVTAIASSVDPNVTERIVLGPKPSRGKTRPTDG